MNTQKEYTISKAIQGKIIVDVRSTAANVLVSPVIKDRIIEETAGYVGLRKMARKRLNDTLTLNNLQLDEEQYTAAFEEQLKRTRSWAYMNKPAQVIMYNDNTIDTELLKSIRCCLINGAEVIYKDFNSKFTFSPQDDWEKINDEIKPLLDIYYTVQKAEKIDTLEWRMFWADYYTTEEMLQTWGKPLPEVIPAPITVTNVHASDLLGDSKKLAHIIHTLRTWADYFMIDVKYDETLTAVSTDLVIDDRFRANNHDEHQNPVTTRKQIVNTKLKLKHDALNKIVEAYLLILNYLDMELQHDKLFVNPKYTLCKCGKPIRKVTGNCEHCGLGHTYNPPVLPLTPMKFAVAPMVSAEQPETVKYVPYEFTPEIPNDAVKWTYADKCKYCTVESCEECWIFNNIIGAGR